MITTIRPYKQSDWETVLSWWKASGEMPPFENMMPLASSFVAEIDGKPALAVAIYLTNTKAAAYVENFIGNPDMKGSDRRQAARELSDHLAKFAKERGYQCLFCMSEKDVLHKRYFELGFHPTLSGVTTFVRPI